ncbi:MAG TPA: PLP-dependent aminotransferase family protein [Dyella sp.]|uniref:MocR-like pyridoxine biosynthesis transcription factor PdxR n=1 Tax=Dyella sp. TaxID=1869338 RepID=UPI002F93EBFE
MYLELDGKGPQYAQLTRAMKSAILSGRLSAGSRLPPTRQLARELTLSRITVLAAYEQLRAEGFIEGRVGSGSYVTRLETKPPPRQIAPDIAAPSCFAQRARATLDRTIAVQHRGLRYNLQFGNPQVNPLLNDIWARELSRAASYTSLDVVRSQGYEPLRIQVADYLGRRRGLNVSADDILIVSGSQQAFSLTARVLVDEGASVVLEEPTYFGARQIFGAYGAQLLPVGVDNDGLRCDELPAQAPALVCVTPSHQFPGGAVTSLQRRLDLLHYAASKRCWVLEDDYDGEFRYDSRPLAAMRSLDEHDRVIYVGTFSKVMFGGLRLAYMVLPQALREDFINAKYMDDFSCPAIEQAALAHFMENGGFERHLRRSTKELRARRDALLAGLREHAGDRVEIVDSPAGIHTVVWLRGYSHALAKELIDYAHERGLGLYPIAPHYFSPPERAGLLLGFCGLPVNAIEEAMVLFGQCLDAFEKKRLGCRS